MTSEKGDDGRNVTDREIVAQKIELLLDVMRARGHEPANFAEIQKEMAKRGVKLSRTRWFRIRKGSSDGRPTPDLLRALADYFDVDANYLLQRDGQISARVEAELNLLNALKLMNVSDVGARTVGDLTPEALNEIAAAINQFRKPNE
ncbi:hypothetical protein [Arthrobacter dokdonensis]|jgi:transcriptional regulator with XRE-family HTH domain|uniref:hypothetical protein n=1 Tax=Arthrobacter dokdonellae TaxID=2211210 RepID=UPI000DE5AAD7|nr:hypothetical protein [Arthrobacter dokdonellae]